MGSTLVDTGIGYYVSLGFGGIAILSLAICIIWAAVWAIKNLFFNKNNT
jgi:hypothetical protein